MALALGATGYWMYIDVPATPNAVVACVIIFNAAFGFSWGPIPWLYPPEIMPLEFRAMGVSLSTATNWAFNWLVGEVTPYLQELIEWRLYPMHGFFCVCSFIVVYFLYPETKGVPLEEMDAVFGEDSRQEMLENETSSKQVSLIGHTLSTISTFHQNSPLYGSMGRGVGGAVGWFREFFRLRNGKEYAPITGNEQD